MQRFRRPHILIFLILAACSEAKTSEKGTGVVVVATTTDADVLFPPLVATPVGRQVTELVYDYLTEVSPSLNTMDPSTFTPRLAKSWRWSPDSLQLFVEIQPGARWHDGPPVHSGDVIYSYSVYTGKALGSPMSSQLSAIDSVTAQDSLTVVFWFNRRYPLQFYDATSQMQILPKHVFERIPQDSLRQAVSTLDPIGSGRFRFVTRKTGESIELAADSVNYRGRPKISRLIWRIFPSQSSAVTALLAGEVDLFDVLRPENLANIARHKELKVMMSPGDDYNFMRFNLRDPKQESKPHRLFASRDLRRALSMAVDRDAMTRNILDSLARPAIGPMISSFVASSTSLDQIPYDPTSAARLLDSLGWRNDTKSGVRSRNGMPLRFTILVPANSTNKKKIAELLQEQLRKVGVDAKVEQMDAGAFTAQLRKREFDASIEGWHLGTSPASIREIWTKNAADKDGINYGSYINPLFDAYVDSAVATMDAAQSGEFYRRAYQTAIDDAPAIWLYEQKLVIGIQNRIRTAPYRPDAWWYSLGDWYIPTSEQIPRDRIK